MKKVFCDVCGKPIEGFFERRLVVKYWKSGSGNVLTDDDSFPVGGILERDLHKECFEPIKEQLQNILGTVDEKAIYSTGASVV